MDFNTLLYRLGIDPGAFVNQENSPIHTEKGFIYEVKQKTDDRMCPYCGSRQIYVHDHDTVEINCSETDLITDTLRIRKVRFKCRKCQKTFTPAIPGIERYSRTSEQTLKMIVQDFRKQLTFSRIAERYSLSTSRIIQIFDEKIPFVPRRELPIVMCVDEIRFEGEEGQKYCCVLYDHESREITDILKSRQLPYLEEYFSVIKERERNHVRYFVSDMHDAYRAIRRKFFPRALHIIDLFHVVKDLTSAVNRIRIAAMNRYGKGSVEYNFMKAHWKVFLCRKENIPDKFYTYRKTGEIFHYDDLLFRCAQKDQELLKAHNALQDLYRYHSQMTFSEALKFIDYMSERLITSGNELLETVGYTYRKWHIEIANGLSRNQSGRRFSNGVAESVNNHLKTIIKAAYGYRNFERFRKRALLIVTYKEIRK